MSLGDVVNQFHNQHSLADTSTSKESNLASLGVWGEQIDDLDASDQDFLFNAHFNERWSFGVDGGSLVSWDGTALVNWLANDVDDASQSLGTDWDTDG